jgi:hypothetical protein
MCARSTLKCRMTLAMSSDRVRLAILLRVVERQTGIAPGVERDTAEPPGKNELGFPFR